jgi:hypothetical protein
VKRFRVNKKNIIACMRDAADVLTKTERLCVCDIFYGAGNCDTDFLTRNGFNVRESARNVFMNTYREDASLFNPSHGGMLWGDPEGEAQQERLLALLLLAEGLEQGDLDVGV